MSATGIAIALAALVAGIAFTIRKPRLAGTLIWALVGAILVSAALINALPGNFAIKTYWLGMLLPLTWVLFQFWCYWDRRPWRPSVGLMVASAASAIIILLIEPSLG